MREIEEVVFENARYSITRIGRYVRRRGVDRFKTDRVRVDRKISPIFSDWPIRAPETNELLWDKPELFAAYVRHLTDLRVPRKRLAAN